MKITNEIIQIGGDGYTTSEDAAVYLLAVNDEAALIDTGCGRSVDTLIENIDFWGIDRKTIRIILLTHCHFDHTGGASELKQRLGCPVAAHKLDGKWLEKGDNSVTAASWYGSQITPCQIDIRFKASEEDVVVGGRIVKAIHVPGHSPGSVVYVTYSEGNKILFGQDVHGPLDSSLLSDERDYQASLRTMLGLQADILCEGHFGVIRGKDNVAEFIRSYMR